MYLKIIGLHVFLAAIKKFYLGNSKHIGANAQEYLMMVSNYDSAFAVWNTLISPALQKTNHVEMESSEDESE